MNSGNTSAPALRVEPLSYHLAIRDFLRNSDAEVWNWLSRQQASGKHAEEVKFELLKSAYRIERESRPDLYDTAAEVAQRLGVTDPITIYQSQHPQGLNASLAYVPGEVHLVLHGPITTQLSPVEVRGLLGHELGHYVLWSIHDGDFLTTNEMLVTLVSDSRAHPAHFSSWRLFRLYSEIYCDRAAYAVTEDLASIVSMLVKVETGVTDVEAESYLRQADEIASRGEVSAKGTTHPEAFIRARAVKFWAEGNTDADGLVTQMLEGTPELDDLDLLEQTKVATLTRRLLDALLCRKWFQTDAVLAHARLYFDDYAPPTEPLIDKMLEQEIRGRPPGVGEYLCFVLLDFVTADRELEELPLAASLLLADQTGLKGKLLELARRELKLRKNQLDRIDKSKESLLADADRVTAAAS